MAVQNCTEENIVESRLLLELGSYVGNQNTTIKTPRYMLHSFDWVLCSSLYGACIYSTVHTSVQTVSTVLYR